MADKNKEQKSLIKIDTKGIQRVQHSIYITNKILNEHENRLIKTDYESVKIGTQIWMSKNLNVDRFINGDLIPEVKSNEEWIKAGEERKPAWSYYNNDPKNGEKYGKLYNCYAVNDSRGLAPTQWHIPSYEDWILLSNYLGGVHIAGYKMKSEMGWYNNNLSKISNKGINESRFSAQPGGSRLSDGSFERIGIDGNWWCSMYPAFNLNLYCFESEFFLNYCDRHNAFSVRCLKD
jgi:uncharacterized protein (TIGR02145 family)